MSIAHAPFNLLTSNRLPSEPLSELLQLLEINHDGTLEDIVKKTQAAWLRKPGSERWHMQNIHEDKQKQILNILDRIGVIKEIKPSSMKYDYVFVHGSALSGMRKRMAPLYRLLKSGYTFNTIVFFTGDRPLDSTIEPEEALLKKPDTFEVESSWQNVKQAPHTEYEMFYMNFQHMKKPEEWKKASIRVITPEQHAITRNGKGVEFSRVPMNGSTRPTTNDTVALWIKSNPKPGSCLVISSQPYIGYQDTITRSALPKEFNIETIGSESTETNIAVHLDNIARWLYAELNRR